MFLVNQQNEMREQEWMTMTGDCRKNEDEKINFMALGLMFGSMQQQTDRSFGIDSKV